MQRGVALGLIAGLGILVLGLSLVLAGLLSSGGPGLGGSVGIVEIEGEILDAGPAVERLHELAGDDGIAAVVVRIDSPGGAVGPSQEIHAEIVRTAARKPVVASLGTLAASGGYYAAVGAGTIMANPGTITGSIGVITHLPNLARIAEKIGFEMEVVKSGPAKDLGNPFRPLSEDERRIFQDVVDGTYDQFVAAVAQGRNLPEDRVREIADGRVITGHRARELGLVDEIGNFRDAIALAGKLGELGDDPHVEWPPEESEGLLFDLLLSSVRGAVRGAVEEVRASLPAPVSYRLPTAW